jgi:uncharacterized membrane protein YeaQ/YmgE (transglycosylase-associated protein family)
MENLLYFLLIGLVAGWLAGLLFRGSGFGLLGDLIIGCVGALLGGFVFGLLGIGAHGLLGSIVCATAGAVLLLLLIKVLRKNRVIK